MKIIKSISNIIGIICVAFGLLGYFTAFFGSSSTSQSTFNSAKAINHINGIATDTDGNIYIGNVEGGYIQVFNSNGVFLYGFSFDTGGSGWFAFGVDANNVVQIVTARTNSYLQYYKGSLVNTQKIDSKQSSILESAYSMSTGNTSAANNRKYRFIQLHTIEIFDQNNNLTKTVSLNVPIFPLSMFSYILIVIIGIGLFFSGFGIKKLKPIINFYTQNCSKRRGIILYENHDLRRR